MQAAFAAAKAALASCVKLIHPLPGAEISLLVDASADHIGLHGDLYDFSPGSLTRLRSNIQLLTTSCWLVCLVSGIRGICLKAEILQFIQTTSH
jgi:hypothetical protein